MLMLHHSNSLNKLAQVLQQYLVSESGAVLEKEQILVQNPGMQRWLQQKISEATGIAANINFPLPSRFIWDIFLSQFDDIDDLSNYDADVLRWRLMSLLNRHADDDALKTLQPYLKMDDRGLARFQLAEKLANLFDQYQVYRPEMIARWQQGKPAASVVEGWQAYLWRLLREQNKLPHRAELITRLIQQLQLGQVKRQGLPRRVFVFAISALSPMYMKVLKTLGQHVEVHIFILNPCAHYWGDIESKKEQINRRLNGSEDQPQVFNTDNELLASLGKQGREYIDQFYDELETPRENLQFVNIVPDTLLKRIQFDILNLGQESFEYQYQLDQSIQLVSCYSELRELQVLHDHLLEIMAANENLHPHDIVVMCPDVNTLTPYIEAVFGMQPEQKRIPFSISDNNELASRPVIQTIIDWLKLPTSRFTSNEILSWLELPALKRNYNLLDEHIEAIRHWLSSTHIHWGLDRAHKQQLGLGANNLNTWSHGIGQLLSAYLMNDATELFMDNVCAPTVLSTTDLYALGQLQKLLDDLQDWGSRIQHPQPLAEWQKNINSLIDALLSLDEDEEWLIKPLREQLANWQTQAARAQFEEKLDATLVSQMLQTAIQQGFTHHQYLSGAINFCNLIPMRSLPFRVVCLIGMGDDRFPRSDTPVHIDLISQKPKKGDRSRREDDRYMFLQSMLSAQEYLYISYVGKNKKDDSIIEPSVVITELVDEVWQSTGVKLEIRQTALQPFSPDNYARGSYAELWQIDQLNEPGRFNQPVDNIANNQAVTLAEFISFFTNPPRYFMEQRLNLSLQEYDEGTDDEELFTLDPLTSYGINKKLLTDLFQTGVINPQKYLNSGALGQQNSGVVQFNRQCQQALTYYQQLAGHQYFSGEHTFDITLTLDHGDIYGQVSSYSDQGLLQMSLSSVKGKSLFPAWIQHCLLSATQQIEFSELYFKDKCVRLENLSAPQATDYLTRMMEFFNQGNCRILPFYVDTAYDYEKTRQEKNEQAARQKVQDLWSGDTYSPFFEAQDSYILTSQKNDKAWPEQFFQLATALMQPLVESLENAG